MIRVQAVNIALSLLRRLTILSHTLDSPKTC